MTTAIEPADWQIEARCCWCRKPFVLEDILGRGFWICETPSCFDRQCRWAIFDVDGGLFHLPTPKQVELEEAVESQRYRHILLGGSRGGSKSTGLRRLAYRYCMKYADFTAVLLRRTFPDLEKDHLLKAAKEVKRIGAKLASRRITWEHNDSQLAFNHCQDDDDWKNYVGAEADLLIFDQFEMFTERQATEIPAMVGRMRRDGWRGVVLYGENPGGPLADYIDEVLISKTRGHMLTPTGERKYPAYDPDQHLFIPTSVEDNPWIDEEYAQFLMALEPAQRARYRWGRRDVFPGQYFPEFITADRVQRLTVSPDLPRVGGLHWGFFRPGIFVWAVVLPDGRLYVEREHVFSEQLAGDVAKDIAAVNVEKHWTFVAVWGNPPSDVPEGQNGEDVFETFRTRGVPAVRSDHDRVTGFLRLRAWFKPMVIDAVAQAGLIISPDCPRLLKTIPALLQDDANEEDCLKTGPEQGANALRYIVMSRPAAPELAAPQIGRDLSTLPAKVADDIQRMRGYDADDARGDELRPGDRGWPFGVDWAASASIVD